ncbi:Lrp/AsnC family transcriptional regulator [Ruegeria sp. A3M17]|uniref:Lrp/AsnC family transcriptional regulator n=1 Tax=Ruegeria sp. A3M17 TaxID=2267229 RepID=UPI000DEB5601|nr:Lrp/AsnC family transcriptional regulator [Ruegeria sp. A3M17]RBW52347.1 Lrp/AsnC family transcriptional regulator [Ruegeria sp. A3M17]
MRQTLQSADIAILQELQKDGRQSMQDLADRTGLSASQCWRRVRDLEAAGIISGYTAQVRAKSVGLNAIAYVHVALREHQEDSINAFLRLIETEPQIVECASITGDHDFILKVYAKTPEELEHFIMQRLLKSGLVRDTRSNFVLRQTKTRGPLPIL